MSVDDKDSISDKDNNFPGGYDSMMLSLFRFLTSAYRWPFPV